MRFNVYFLLGLFMIPLISCENEEKFFVETETSLAFDILMATSDDDFTKSVSSLNQLNSFSGEGIYKGTRITNFENTLYRIEDVKPHMEPHLLIREISETGEIQSLQLEWGYKSSPDEDFNIQGSVDLMAFEHTAEDGNYKVALGNSLVELINKLDSNPENSIRIKVTGTSDFNFDNEATLEIPVVVKSSFVSTRFELF